MEKQSTNNYVIAKLVEKKPLVEDILKMTFELDDCKFSAPGQYANIRVKGSDLDGDYNMSEYDSNRFIVVYRVSTDMASKELSLLELGDEAEVITGLGNGYTLDEIPNDAVIVADTTGIPQMLGLVKELLMQGKECKLYLGYSSKDRIFMIDFFRNLCNNIEILTADGSNGREGRADDAVRDAKYVCASGSIEMLDRLSKKAEAGQFNVDGTNVVKF